MYARVCAADHDMDPELSCVSATTLKADGFGELCGGMMFECSTLRARQFLNAQHGVLVDLSKRFPFEMAVGINGRVWVKSSDNKNTLAAIRAMRDGNSEASIQ